MVISRLSSEDHHQSHPFALHLTLHLLSPCTNRLTLSPTLHSSFIFHPLRPTMLKPQLSAWLEERVVLRRLRHTNVKVNSRFSHQNNSNDWHDDRGEGPSLADTKAFLDCEGKTLRPLATLPPRKTSSTVETLEATRK